MWGCMALAEPACFTMSTFQNEPYCFATSTCQNEPCCFLLVCQWAMRISVFKIGATFLPLLSLLLGPLLKSNLTHSVSGVFLMYILEI